MRRFSITKIVLVFATTILTFSFMTGYSFAACQNAQTCSTNYKVNEAFFGSGGNLDASSTNYQAKQSAGETSVGNTQSTSYQAQAGFNTNRQPSLTFQVNSSTIDLGSLTPGTPTTTTATFSVKAYLTSGYNVTTASDAPTNGSYHMTSPSTPETVTQMASNNHEFGINLVSNASCGSGLPSSLGAGPSQAPNSSFSFGQVSTNYGTACKFQYIKGDTVAYSTQSSGETDYTISYVFDSNSLTPGGTYVFNQDLVATATY